MPKLVVNPKGRYSFEANFNPVLRMSNNAIASVMFKMDVERAKYNSAIKRLDGEAKTELRISQREMEVARRELQELKAYQRVAELTAFKTFDPELRRRAKEREEKERQRQTEEEKEKEAQELEEYKEKEVDSIRRRLERRRKEEENRRGISYANMALLSRKPSISEGQGQDPELAEVQRRNRRLSSTGNVYVTLKDIMDNDDVLQRHSEDILNVRRSSQDTGPSSRRQSQDLGPSNRRPSHDLGSSSRRASLVSVPPKRRASNTMSSSAPDLSRVVSSETAQECQVEVDFASCPQGEEGHTEKDNTFQVRNRVFSKVKSDKRRRSRIGSISSLVQQVIQENRGCSDEDDNGEDDNTMTIDRISNLKADTKVVPESNEASTIFITDISELNEDYNAELNDCLPRNLNANPIFKKLGAATNIGNKQRDTWVSSDNISSKSDSTENDDTPGSSKAVPVVKSSSRQGLFDVLSQLRSNREEKDEVDGPENTDDHQAETSGETGTAPDAPATGKPGLLRGLARFKSVANFFAEKKREEREEAGGVATAAVVMANSAAQGKVPSAFMLHHLSPVLKGEARRRGPKLETVHQQSGSLKLRPLQMPRSVQRQHEKKFEELMATINGAVHWKVRALRENTGTLNPRQLRRQQREQEQQQQKQEQQQKQKQQEQQQQQQQQKQKQQNQVQFKTEPKQQPVIAVRPRRERIALPGACTTTWSLKRFVQKEVKELLASWQPENARRLRSQRLKTRLEMGATTAAAGSRSGGLLAGGPQTGHRSA